jgi:hypothetical protein
LLARDPAAHVSLDSPTEVAVLLAVLHEVGASDAAGALLARDPAAHVSIDDPEGVGFLVDTLYEAGASDAARALAARAVNAGIFTVFLETHPDDAPSYRFGREPDGAPSQSWKWQGPGSQNDGLRVRQPDS